MFKSFTSFKIAKNPSKRPSYAFERTPTIPSFTELSSIVHTVPTLQNNGIFFATFATKKKVKEATKGEEKVPGKSVTKKSIKLLTDSKKKAKKAAKGEEKVPGKSVAKKETKAEKAKRKQEEIEKKKALREKQELELKKAQEKEKRQKAKEKEKREKLQAKLAKAKVRAERAKKKEEAKRAKQKQIEQKQKEQELLQIKEAGLQAKKQKETEKELAKRKAYELAHPPKPPRAKSAYIYFVQDNMWTVREAINREFPDKSRGEIMDLVMKRLGEKWASMDEESKLAYTEKADVDKAKREQALAEYNYAKGPKKPQSAYVLFFNFVRPQLVESHPGQLAPSIAKLAGERWQQLSEEEKKGWFQQAAEKREEYLKIKAKWQSGILGKLPESPFQ